jgi:hypothetical protein
MEGLAGSPPLVVYSLIGGPTYLFCVRDTRTTNHNGLELIRDMPAESSRGCIRGYQPNKFYTKRKQLPNICLDILLTTKNDPVWLL